MKAGLDDLYSLVGPSNLLLLGEDRLGLSFWVWLSFGGRLLEGKFFLSRQFRRKLVVVIPGFPGDFCARQEVGLRETLSREGYCILAIRHCGVLFNEKTASRIIQCDQRVDLAKERKEQGVGSVSGSLDLSFREVLVAVEVLSAVYEEISIVSHSFGTLAALYSLVELAGANEAQSHPSRSVRRLISFSGAVGYLPKTGTGVVRERWLRHFTVAKSEGLFAVESPEDSVVAIEKAYRFVHSNADLIEETTDFIFVCPWSLADDCRDEFVSVSEILETLLVLGRGGLILDTQQQRRNHEMSHDFPFLDAGYLLELLSTEVAGLDGQWTIR